VLFHDAPEVEIHGLRVFVNEAESFGFGLLPVAYSAGVNVATFLVMIVPMIVSFVALIKGVIRKVKK
jgi:hypothetical protein